MTELQRRVRGSRFGEGEDPGPRLHADGLATYIETYLNTMWEWSKVLQTFTSIPGTQGMGKAAGEACACNSRGGEALSTTPCWNSF